MGESSSERRTAGFRVQSRRSSYGALIGIAVGSLVTGLALPFVLGERQADAPVSAGAGFAGEAGGSSAGAIDGVLDDTTSDVGGGDDAAESAVGQASGADRVPRSTGTDAAGAATTPRDSAPAATGGDAGGPPLEATDVGVTAETIKLGFLLLDVGSIGRLGIGVPGVDPEQQRAAFEAQLAEVNERGGINGRKVVGVYETFGVLTQDEQRRACLALRDKKPFAVAAAGGYGGPSILCMTEEGGTPLVSNGSHGTPSEYVRRSQGRLFSMFPASDRMMAIWASELARLGALKGKTIGIVSQETVNPGDSVVGGALIPALARAGHEPAHVSRLSADQNSAASQIPVEVQQMRSKGVDFVMLVSSTIASTQFVQAADHQGYRPQYSLTDWASMNNDVSNQSMPDSYDGTIGITTYRVGEERVGVGETEPEQACRATYEEGTGNKLGPKGSNEYGLIQGNCTTLDALLLGLAEAGPELTRASFSHGMQAVGPFPMSMWGGGSFAPGKFGAADQVRTIRWFADCRCLKPTDGFRMSRS